MVEKYELDQNQMEGTKTWKSKNSTNRRKILNGGNERIGLKRGKEWNVATNWWKTANCSEIEEMN
jgi:hypothetical protein